MAHEGRVERAVWLDRPDADASGADRIYFGHETCFGKMPGAMRALESLSACRAAGKPATLVTPPVREEAWIAMTALLEAVLAEDPGMEVVCSDWGVLRWLARVQSGRPVAGRLLAAQPADPRLIRLFGAPETDFRTILTASGAPAMLRQAPPPPALLRHLQSVWIDRPASVEVLMAMGIARVEVSHVCQGLNLAPVTGFAYTLHVSDAPVAVLPCCADARQGCRHANCPAEELELRHASVPRILFRRDNAVFYHEDTEPSAALSKGIDRVVVRAVGDYPPPGP